MIPSLELEDSDYLLHFFGEHEQLQSAVLPGGAAALIRRDALLGEASLERAIEIAEDWLMPHAAHLRGTVLEIHDPGGRFENQMKSVLAITSREWTVPEIEALFLQVVDMGTGRNSAALQGHLDFVADLLLVRELAHHGRVSAVRLQ